MGIFIFLFGLAVGSFLNVVIDRVPHGRDIVKKRSFCDSCSRQLRWHDLIPVVSFALLKGKCRYCRSQISHQYPLIELVTGILFVVAFQQSALAGLLSDSVLSISQELLIFLYFLFVISVLLVVFVTDLKYLIVPDKVIFPAIMIGLIMSFAVSLGYVQSQPITGFFIQTSFHPFVFPAHFTDALWGIAFFEAIFLSLFLISRGKWLGFGDVKLGFLLGLLGGLRGGFTIFLCTFFSAAVVGILLLIMQKAGMKSKLPLGSFLSLATLFVLFTGFSFLEFINFR